MRIELIEEREVCALWDKSEHYAGNVETRIVKAYAARQDEIIGIGKTRIEAIKNCLLVMKIR